MQLLPHLFRHLFLLLLVAVVIERCVGFSSPQQPAQHDTVVRIRPSHGEDAKEVALLFQETVHTVNLGDYTASQVLAWAPADRQDLYDIRDWSKICSQQEYHQRYTIVAELDYSKKIVGFAELEVPLIDDDHDDNDDRSNITTTMMMHVDCFYCHKDHQRQGIGRKLYQEIEEEARRRCRRSDSVLVLIVEASTTAKPFFERMGFTTIRQQTVSCRGESFINYQMEKEIQHFPQ